MDFSLFAFNVFHRKIKWRDLRGEEGDSAPPALWHIISDVLEVEEMAEN